MIKKSDFTIYAKYVNKKNSKDVKWGKVDTNYIALSQNSAQSGKFKVKVQYPTAGVETASLATGAKTKELTLNTTASTVKKVIVATGTAKTAKKVQLSWTKTKGADGYRIYGNKYGKKSTPKYLKTVKKGTKTTITKTAVIKAKVNVPSGKKQPKNHGAKIRYITSKGSVATVNNKGKIRAKKAGKATIYVISENGKYKKVSVTVK